MVVYTLLGAYEPIAEKMLFSFSYTDHDQNSMMPYHKQRIGFGQLTWDEINNHDLLLLRYQYYDETLPQRKGILIGFRGLCTRQITLTEKHKVLFGFD
jgi:outer membrane receptor for ferrienterochelin and colicins